MARPELKLKPEVLFRNGKPKSVLLDYTAYKELLTRLEDQADLDFLQKITEQGEKYRPIDELLSEFK